jgi:hypothetical protein
MGQKRAGAPCSSLPGWGVVAFVTARVAFATARLGVSVFVIARLGVVVFVTARLGVSVFVIARLGVSGELMRLAAAR